ncbi:MAG: hypothetical protein MI923_24385 [Phycisphaerales bacterium]|nr:hypothetical protein [Phycisphaerales bacterium]
MYRPLRPHACTRETTGALGSGEALRTVNLGQRPKPYKPGAEFAALPGNKRKP